MNKMCLIRIGALGAHTAGPLPGISPYLTSLPVLAQPRPQNRKSPQCLPARFPSIWRSLNYSPREAHSLSRNRTQGLQLMKAGSQDHVGRFQVSVAWIFTNSFSETPSDPCSVPDPQADPVHLNSAAPPKLGQEAIWAHQDAHQLQAGPPLLQTARPDPEMLWSRQMLFPLLFSWGKKVS